MIITHSFNNISEKEKEASFLLVNKRGSYFSLGNSTSFQGLHYIYSTPDAWSYYKLIENITIDKEPRELINHIFYIERKNILTTEKFYFLNHGLVYDVQNYTGKCFIDLDFRDIFDYDEKGRIYNTTFEDGVVLVEYRKYSDDSLQQIKKQMFLAIKTKGYEKTDQWIEKKYPYDNLRGTKHTFWIYRALNIPISGSAHILFSYGETKHDAVKNLESLEKNKNHLIHLEQTYTRHLMNQIPKKVPEKIQTTYVCAIKSLENLLLNMKSGEKSFSGIFAGLPWFFQFWSRDEMISLKALMHAEKYVLCKLIMFKLMQTMMENGRITNRTPYANLGTADSIGWLFKRLKDLIEITEKKGAFKECFTKNDLQFVMEKLEQAIQKTQKNFVHDFLVWNNPKETWMDTDFSDDKRDGKRIEIQVLWLNMISLMIKLLKKTNQKTKKYKILMKRTLTKVRETFFKDNILYDGENDPTIRPNIFLAHYIYPEMLSKKEWKKVFQNSLPKLWLKWGGLATIDKDSPKFCRYYSGQNNQSYHRGDSWYFLNNIAAISLYSVDKKMFKQYIDKIMEASVEDCLFQGFAGHCSELSSAMKQDASGTWCQSWSNATLIELIEKIFP